MLKLFKTCVLAALFTALPVSAVTPSPAMIAQFQNLSPAEQQRLAKQYGIELPTGSAGAAVTQQAQPEVLVPAPAPVQQSSTTDSTPVTANTSTKRFGMAMFNSKVSTFAPVDNAPVPENYRLGPDDILLLQLFGKQNSSTELIVDRNGTVNLPEIGPVSISGLTVGQASGIISNKVREAMMGVDAAVTMGKLRTINIFVAGEAKTPGMYAVSALTTVTQSLYVAGGVSDIGSLRDIQVKRAGQTVGRFDLYDLLLRGDSTGDLQLQHGDVVFIAPVKATVQIAGEIKRAAIYEIKSGDSIDTLLSMAGGTTAGAYPQSVVLERYNSNNLRDLINLDLTNAVNRQMALRDGDVLRIAETSPRIENVVTIAGAVVRPGFYAWQQGIKVSDLIKSFWSDVHLTADLDYALVVREINNAGDVKVLQFNLANAINHPVSEANIELKPRDLILVFHHANETIQRDKLNAYIRAEITQRYSLPADVKWTAEDDLSSKAFQSMLGYDNQVEAMQGQAGKSSTAGELRIVDSQTTTNQNSVGAVVANPDLGRGALPAIMQRMMSQLFRDKNILALSASFNRTELLYPILKKLKMQVRGGTDPLIISVNGEVKVPGDYPLTEGANVVSLIAAASGLTESAFLSRAELTRAVIASDSNSIAVNNIAIDLNKVFSKEDVVALQQRDRLNVFPIPDWNINRTIEIRGEVKFPGRYTIQRGETLSDVLERAGGLNRSAFMAGAIYTREDIKERERVQTKKLAQQLRADIATKGLSESGMSSTPQDALFMIKQLEDQPPIGRLVIDLPSILAGQPDYDVQVQNGDLLYVPRIDNTVSVVGEVQHSSSHRFQPNLSVDDYLKLAGGTRKRADDERVYVIKADGSVMMPEQNGWFAVKDIGLEPGDTVVVPVDTEYKDNLTLWGQFTQIFYQSAVAIAALNTF
ncbi:SLBB domain-containing protein [Rheinheimera sp. 1928-s]|uniref:SLBB domain-containing protein n=1 Tax=Rheinheimera sp. 1928-s TaxID=3033803 RepID=UPI002603AC12|nr:SLBB domain-containing protein [Rheinheimera sp. 1928-s]MDF3125771.1 SLBB domain-containing protein [Rheinheimera sp. 1928-s]